MIKFIGVVILFFLSIPITSCDLKIKEDDFFVIPAYRTVKIDSLTTGTILHKRFFVKNYAYHKAQFDSISKNILCEALNDSIPLVRLDFTFLDGEERYGSDLIAEYLWTLEHPNQIRIMKGEEMNYKEITVPFDCDLNDKYEKVK